MQVKLTLLTTVCPVPTLQDLPTNVTIFKIGVTSSPGNHRNAIEKIKFMLVGLVSYGDRQESTADVKIKLA